MSKLSERVKEWRRNNKLKIVEAMGGECVCCGYKKCTSALSLHHINPSEKDINFSKMRANPIAWEKLILELRKCVLVCATCHMEIHDGMTKIPQDARGFDESFAKIEETQNECPICGKLKNIKSATCSRKCAGKQSWRVQWEKIDLEKELNNKTKVQLASELGISDSAINKRLKKLNKHS